MFVNVQSPFKPVFQSRFNYRKQDYCRDGVQK